MKVLLALHGFPPELHGGTEAAVLALARGLMARGHDVLVVAGSIDHGPSFRRTEGEFDGLRVIRLHRADLYFDHWQKSYSAAASEAFEAILTEERPDLVHVHHWIRLSRDLVACAARASIPAAITLHDHWSSCLVTFRVRPDTREACDAPLAPSPCLACAALVPPRTPWVPAEAQAMALAAHRADLARELRLARAVLAPTRSHAETVARMLGLDAGGIAVHAVPNGRDLGWARRDAPPAPTGDQPLVLASWGNLHPLKGFDLVLRAVAALPDPRRVRLHLAGAEVDPDHARRLRDLARDLDATFHGPFQPDDLPGHPVGEAHALVSGTRARESWGLVADEACALGLPMVLPRAGAFPERLEEGRGALFYRPGDRADLTRILARLLEEPGLAADLRAGLPETEVFAPGLDAHVEAVLAAYGRVRAAGPPEAPPRDWWETRLRRGEEASWDASLAQASPEELGLA